jgi:Common central domain of tyrosinase
MLRMRTIQRQHIQAHNNNLQFLVLDFDKFGAVSATDQDFETSRQFCKCTKQGESHSTNNMRTESTCLHLALLTLSLGLSQHVVNSQDCPSPRDRRPWRLLSCQEQQEYMDALTSLKRSGIYDDFTLTHEWMNKAAHGRPAFLPWHRWYLWEFESALRRVAANPCITYVNSVVRFRSSLI